MCFLCWGDIIYSFIHSVLSSFLAGIICSTNQVLNSKPSDKSTQFNGRLLCLKWQLTVGAILVKLALVQLDRSGSSQPDSSVHFLLASPKWKEERTCFI